MLESNLIDNARLVKSIKQFIQKYQNIEKDEKLVTEKKYDQVFWDELTQIIFGTKIQINRQYDVSTGHGKKWIDLYLPDTKVIIEQKSSDIDLDKPQQGHDGKTPYEQALEYRGLLKTSETANWIIVSNFKEFHIYNMNVDCPIKQRTVIRLEELGTRYKEFDFLIDRNIKRIIHEKEVSTKAGAVIGKIYRLLLDSYKEHDIELTADDYETINIICVRLVFCLYAEDANIFGNQLFGKFLSKYRNELSSLQINLAELFSTLDTPEEQRKRFLNEELKQFPYVNGGLFRKEVEIPYLSENLVNYLIDSASEETDWSGISPTIFGAIFESTLNNETRSTDGVHFTSIENIHKVIDPLFLNDLHSEFNNIVQFKQANIREQKLLDFQNRIASLKFLDPACGSGNFLTETYISLRRLEDQILLNIAQNQGEIFASEKLQIKVSIRQFFGIEINDFAVDVAKTALWIAESQCLQNTLSLGYKIGYEDFLPLKDNSNIVLGNSLTTDWNSLVPASELDFIMGNPPFVGARFMNKTQKEDIARVWDGTKNLGNLDYVSCWYQIASEYMKDTRIQASLVSTNSICQGEQAGLMWKPLFDKGITINNAYQTFIWDSESFKKAHVYCVIIQFSYVSKPEKTLYAEKTGTPHSVSFINQYLLPFYASFIENRKKPLCAVPNVGIGNKPIDGGYYLFNEEEMNDFIKREPQSEKYFKKWYGADEFVNGYCRYCLWLGDCSPKEIRSMPLCLERVEKVRDYRLASKSLETRKIAEKPTRFHVENMPKGNYILVPRVSSERRLYIPIGFITPDVFASDAVQIIPNATLYDFGILESLVHMAWMRVVTGRLKSDYRYSAGIVYNNFVWVKPTDKQKERIEQSAQGILDARNKYPDCSLADLYDPLLMPSELKKAHENNDRAVLELYGLPKDSTEEDMVNLLFRLYESKITGNNDTGLEFL